MNRIKAFLAREWAQVSTKFGLILTAISTTAPQFAQFDPRLAIIGAAAGVALILYRGEVR